MNYLSTVASTTATLLYRGKKKSLFYGFLNRHLHIIELGDKE